MNSYGINHKHVVDSLQPNRHAPRDSPDDSDDAENRYIVQSTDAYIYSGWTGAIIYKD